MTDIDAMIDELIEREGGYVDNAADRGGATRFGITERVARDNGYNGPMRELPRALAAAIYRRRYWQAPGFDRVAAIAPRVAAELLDTGVNMGPAVAVGFLQRALNALNRQGRDFPDVEPSHVIDAPTLAALTAYVARRGATGEAVLLKAVEALQGARYIELAERRPANESFVNGWLARRIG